MDVSNRYARRALFVLGLSVIVSGVGCGGAADEKGLTPVSGRVTLDGGSWPKPGKITFVPKSGSEGSNALRPVSADFDTSGNFTVSSFDGNKGAYPGEYWGSVECWEVEPGMASGDAAVAAAKKKGATMMSAGTSAVPKKYQSSETSGLSLKVEAGQAATVTFDVKSK